MRAARTQTIFASVAESFHRWVQRARAPRAPGRRRARGRAASAANAPPSAPRPGGATAARLMGGTVSDDFFFQIAPDGPEGPPTHTLHRCRGIPRAKSPRSQRARGVFTVRQRRRLRASPRLATATALVRRATNVRRRPRTRPRAPVASTTGTRPHRRPQAARAKRATNRGRAAPNPTIQQLAGATDGRLHLPLSGRTGARV